MRTFAVALCALGCLESAVQAELGAWSPLLPAAIVEASLSASELAVVEFTRLADVSLATRFSWSAAFLLPGRPG